MEQVWEFDVKIVLCDIAQSRHSKGGWYDEHVTKEIITKIRSEILFFLCPWLQAWIGDTFLAKKGVVPYQQHSDCIACTFNHRKPLHRAVINCDCYQHNLLVVRLN